MYRYVCIKSKKSETIQRKAKPSGDVTRVNEYAFQRVIYTIFPTTFLMLTYQRKFNPYAKFIMYVSDVKIYCAINSITDCRTLQTDHNRFSIYLKINHIQLNLLNVLTLHLPVTEVHSYLNTMYTGNILKW